MNLFKRIFDNKGTWLGLGAIAGATFGPEATQGVNVLGALVMGVL